MASVARTFRIGNRLGLHMRAAAMLVQTASGYDADIAITKDDQTVSGKSIIGLMMLAAAEGSEILVEANGTQAEEALAGLAELIERKFDED